MYYIITFMSDIVYMFREFICVLETCYSNGILWNERLLAATKWYRICLVQISWHNKLSNAVITSRSFSLPNVSNLPLLHDIKCCFSNYSPQGYCTGRFGFCSRYINRTAPRKWSRYNEFGCSKGLSQPIFDPIHILQNCSPCIEFIFWNQSNFVIEWYAS